MIQKKKLVMELGKMIACKERIAVLANQTLLSAVQLAGQANKNQEEMVALLREIGIRQVRHMEMIRQVQTDMEGYLNDVY